MDCFDVGINLLFDILNFDLDIDLSNMVVDYFRINIDLDSIFGILNFIDCIISFIILVIVLIFECIFIDLLEQIIILIVFDFVKDILIKLQLIILDDGEELNIKVLFIFLDSFGNGISVDFGICIWVLNLFVNILGVLGFLYCGGDIFSLGVKMFVGILFDFGVFILDNVINQVLFVVYEVGVIIMNINLGIYVNVILKGIVVYDVDDSEIKDVDKIGMWFDLVLLLYVKFMLGDGVVGVFGWDDVILMFDLYKVQWGEYCMLFGVIFNLEVVFDVNSIDDGFLSIGIE